MDVPPNSDTLPIIVSFSPVDQRCLMQISPNLVQVDFIGTAVLCP